MNHIDNPKQILRETALVDRFLDLVKYDTRSNEDADSCPSTEGQLVALQGIRQYLEDLGIDDAEIDENGYLFATLKGNCHAKTTIGLLAHVDTSPDFSGTDVKPVLHENYDGSVLQVNNAIEISPQQSPNLMKCIGDTIITADGTTLLGADDKAGIAEILASVEFLAANPEIPRPNIRLGFTPDEEIGRGSDKFDIKAFGADCAYTLDGGFSGEINGETFSADSATVHFTGVAVHPGYAKGKLVNALRYAAKFIEKLPRDEAPETTEGREGFFHPTRVQGNANDATVSLLLRDFDTNILKKRSRLLEGIREELIAEEPNLKVDIEISESYRNMVYWLDDNPKMMELLVQAVKLAGIEPQVEAIRGGTDGSGLTAKGLPTPNIFAGGVNFHGPREWVSTRVMAQSVCTIVNLVQLWAED